MNVLIWNTPWVVQSNLLFSLGAFKNELYAQAELLISNKCEVDAVLSRAALSALSNESFMISDKINVVTLETSDMISATRSCHDISERLYANDDRALIERIAAFLKTRLRKRYDIILFWETPVPFLELLYPDALFLHEMPGAFNRPPYPATLMLDSSGLYKDGVLYRYSEDIVNKTYRDDELSLTSQFISLSDKYIRQLNPFSRNDFTVDADLERLSLLPLQTSLHYAFKVDTPYGSQIDFLLATLNSLDPRTALIATQYISPLVSDAPLTPDVVKVLRRDYPNFIFDERFNNIQNSSQYLAPLVDEVISCSSGVAFQGLLFNKKLTVPASTFISPYDTSRLTAAGIDVESAIQNLLCFVVNYHQASRHLIYSEKDFFLHLLEDRLAKKRAGKQRLDLYTNFGDILPDYKYKLNSTFQPEAAGRAIARRSGALNPDAVDRFNAEQKFRQQIESSDVKYISFDIFDTLVGRPFAQPSDLFMFLELEINKLIKPKLFDFYNARIKSESMAARAAEGAEITLDEIYAKVKEHYDLSEEKTLLIRNMEITLEKQLIRPLEGGLDFWNIALKSKKPIICVSDMYLPYEVIAEILKKNGYSGYQKLYLSSREKVKKSRGDLFKEVVADLGCKPNNILHIGDNVKTDVESAKKCGLVAWHCPSPMARLRNNHPYGQVFSKARQRPKNLSDSILTGMTALKTFGGSSKAFERFSMFKGSPYLLGYNALGPLATSYMLWLGRQSARHNVAKLFFLTREGTFLKKVYDVFFKDQPQAPCSTELLASRRSVMVASIMDAGDVASVALLPYAKTCTVKELMGNRFGLEADDDFLKACEEAGFTSAGEVIGDGAVERDKLIALCRLMSERIINLAAEERAAYLDYLEQKGLRSEPRPAIVDVGWKGTLQNALSGLLDRDIPAYYYALAQEGIFFVNSQNVSSQAGSFLDDKSFFTFMPNPIPVFEHLLTSGNPSLAYFAYDRNGNLKPHFQTDHSQGTRRGFVDQVQNGALRFAADIRQMFGNCLDNIEIDPYAASTALRYFLQKPSDVDAQMFVGQVFEDNFAGHKAVFLIDPQLKMENSRWKDGVKIINNSRQSKPSQTQTEVDPEPANPKVDSSLVKLERWFMKKIVSEKKFSKLLYKRKDFFMDSRFRIFHIWYKITSRA